MFRNRKGIYFQVDTDPALVVPLDPAPVQPPAPSATKDEPPAEHMIPKSRLDEVIAARDKAEKDLKALQDAEAERKKSELSEVERAKQEKQEADTRAEKAEKELADQRATIAAEKAFAAVVAKLNLGFFNDKAREDAFALMDMSKPTEFENVIKKLKEEKPYLFKEIEVPDLDAKDKGKSKNGVLTDAQKADIRKRYRINN